MTTGENNREFVDNDLSAFGEREARRLTAAGSFSGRREARRIRALLGALESARVSPEGAAGEWLADNRYLIEREALRACADFSSVKSLRSGRENALLCEAMAALCSHMGGAVTLDAAGKFLDGFQRVSPLPLGELALIGAALRAGLTELIASEFSAGEPDVRRVSSSIESLRMLSTADLTHLTESADAAGGILSHDPAGVYSRMDERSRAYYRRRLARLARREHIDECECARRVLSLAEAHRDEPKRGHVGWWLLSEPLGKKPRTRNGALYAFTVAALALGISLAAGVVSGGAAACLLTLLPAAELVKNALDAALLRALPVRILPRLELSEGVPECGRTICVVSAILASPKDGETLSRRLEEFRLASRECGGELRFGILADLPESRNEHESADEASVEAAKRAIDGLNEKYGGGFYLFFRPRREARRDRIWRGYERKRGALLALASLCAGRGNELGVLSGDEKALSGTRYIVTLDADTRVLPGSLRELIGAMLHPLARAEIDAKSRSVVSGRGIIHPRIGVELAASEATPFARALAGPGGVDPYNSACGEVWMDLTGRGGFAGKGIIDTEAMLECCSGLPEDLVLSHDAVEGALLRGGYMGDTEFIDGFPASPLSYFKRQHRWVRGDWQNLAVLFRFRRRVSVPDRLKLLDSVRRSLSAPAALAAMSLSLLLPELGLYPAGIVAALSLCSGLAGAVLRALTRRSGRERHPGKALHGAALRVCQIVLKLLFLPWEAWTDLSAAVTALWRMLVSRRRRLQWQTSAQSGGGTFTTLRAAWPGFALGLAMVFFSPLPAGIALGLVWLVSPAFAVSLGRENRPAAPLGSADRRFLLEECAKIWAYFDEFCTSERGYLPPDNYQEQPPAGIAERTSPTNIGLAMVSALCAMDLGLAEPPRTFELIDGMLSTCEALPKWSGHLYNWYDTRSLVPLEPRYVSTVDSGNLAASLTALSAGLREYGRADLAGRCAALARGMDFAALFDSERRLFHIGFDARDGHLSEGCYDLMASEARLTGYYAVASGAVPVRHWRQLSRALVRRDGYRGLASWTGTMFEYLMPELFLPLERGSLLWESARFCLYVQRRDIPDGEPWGESESAFFSLDASLSYRYKAHGCAALALQRGMGSDTVCAPYAAYLALAVAPREAVRDLRRFAGIDAGGRFGLWEAVDFTPSRTSGGGEVVRCVMAHHLGMSLIAAANCLTNGRMRRRFMSEPAMAAYAPLLAERAPEGAVVLRRRAYQPPVRERERERRVISANGVCAPTSEPRVFTLSNGVYHAFITETGLMRSAAGGVMLYRGFEDALHGPAGLRFRLHTGGKCTELLPVPGTVNGRFNYRLRGGVLRFDGEADGFECSHTAGVSARELGEVRIVEIRPRAALRGELTLEFEPSLAREADWASHPAYWRLGLTAKVRDGMLLIRRLARGGMGGCWLCVACDAPAEWRANLDGEPLGALSRPYVTARVALNIRAGGSARVRFALAFAATEDEAAASAQRTLHAGAAQLSDLVSALGAVYGLGGEHLDSMPDIAGRILFPRVESSAPCAREELWACGISGDYPIAAARVSELTPAAIASISARHALMRICGVRADLVLITGDGGDYHRKNARAVAKALSAAGLDSLAGARGGIHCADSDAAYRAAAVIFDGSPSLPARSFPPKASNQPLDEPRRGGEVAYRQSYGVFTFTVNGRLPGRAWCLPMSNGRFGYMASDCGLGNMWTDNAREKRVNDWVCDDRAHQGPETLEAETAGGVYSLFAAEDDKECRVSFGAGWASWEKLGAHVTAFVPLESDARVFIIEGAPGRVRWHTRLQLAAEARDACFTVTRLENGLLRARNERGGMELSAAFSQDAVAFTCDEAAWCALQPGGETGAGLAPCFGAVFEPSDCLVIVCGSCTPEALTALAEPDMAKRELERVRARFDGLRRRVRIESGRPELDGYVNDWAVYQALACRMTARTSLYQSGGAYGFRDQLQDAINLLPVDTSLARGRILDACAHQYAEGDVMHWWHALSPDRGVRTRISDDLLWLPWAVCEYLDFTHDAGLLDERVTGLGSAELAPGEDSRYEQAVPGRECSVLEHASAALKCVLRRGFGEHGLLLMGTGDWCDGFDAVGRAGRGESVWLTEFFAHTSRRFAAVLEARGDTPSAAVLMSSVRRCIKGVEDAWDGEWYRRGYFDDGRPLGSRESSGCRIDAIAQAWAAFAGCDETRVKTALNSAYERLFDRKLGICKLFEPPFGDGGEYAGYVNSYGEGFRENGGQYTHGAIWLALACLEHGMADKGREILLALLHRGENYGAEPFVLAADVYSNPARAGEAGWSWYTGSAGWYLRAALRAFGGDGKM